MTTWAYQCYPADKSIEPWLVSCMTIDAMPSKTRIVRVRVGSQWLCGTVDRSRQIEAEGMLLRQVVPSDEADCPECVEAPAPEPAGPVGTAASVDPARDAPSKLTGRQVQAAAIAMQGRRFVVVLVGLDLVQSAGEADMAIADFRPRFGGVDVVLMGQQEDGTPQYHGDAAVVALLAHVPIDQMPWKSYPLG